MSTQPGDPSSTAFDLFDRWMTNREQPAQDEPAANVDVVISDTKSSREAARKLLEAVARAEREAVPPESSDLVDAEPIEPVEPPETVEPPAPVASAAPAPAAVEPAQVETPPAAARSTPLVPSFFRTRPTEPPVVETPVVETPVVETPVIEPEPVAETPVIEPEPVAEIPVDEPAALQPPVEEETPVLETPVEDEAPVLETPVEEDAPVLEAPVEEPLTVAWAEPVAEPEPEPEPEPLADAWVEPVAEPEPEPEQLADAWVEPEPQPEAEPEPPTLTRPPVVDEAPVPTPPPATGGGKRRAAVPTDAPAAALPVDPDAGSGKHAAPAADPVAVSMFTLPVMPTVVAPPTESVRTAWFEDAPEDEAVDEVVAQDPEPAEETTVDIAAVAPPQADSDDSQGPNLRLIVTTMMTMVLLGAAGTAYLFLQGDQWALKPAAMLSALGAFLVTNKVTTRTLV